MNIKAIKTSYDGNVFRSRLEARWAVFFNALSIKYRYETDMVQVGDLFSENYIVDFHLPDLHLYVEIKGQSPTQREINKAAGWANEFGPVLILAGSIDLHTHETNNSYLFSFPWDSERPSSKPILYKDAALGECPRCGSIDVSRSGTMPDICDPKQNHDSKCFTADEIDRIYADEDYPDCRFTKRLMEAYAKAIQFKFDDSPLPRQNNRTNTSMGGPTTKMIQYADSLCRKHHHQITESEISMMSYDGVSQLIDQLKRRPMDH